MEFLLEDANTHLEHLEDDIILNGAKGGENALNFLDALRDMLQGSSNKKVNLTVKWDGAPAIVAGIDPSNGKFFVATKSLFNKTPKINYTPADIVRNHTGEVANILRECLLYLKPLNFKGILQGDLMFTQKLKKTRGITSPSGKKEQVISFQPNTIVYTVPEKTGLGQRIARAKLGIIFHTTYRGSSIDKLKASFGADVSKLRRSPNVWFDDATYKDVTGNVMMTLGEGEQLTKMLNMARGSLKKSTSLLNKMQTDLSDYSVGLNLKTYLNTFIRQMQDVPTTTKAVSGFRNYYEGKVGAAIDKVKRQESKDKYKKILEDGLRFIDRAGEQVYFAIATYKTIQRAKKVVVDKLNKATSIGTFVVKGNGLEVTNPEGYVVVDGKGTARKLVDRLEFSAANFTAAKRWDKGTSKVA